MNACYVGIYCYEQPDQLNLTLESIQRHTTRPLQLILLPDGPDPSMSRWLKGREGLSQLGTKTPQGTAACFNRLIQSGSADVYVLLESGSIVGPGWLDHLIAAFDSDPSMGLAGPSTNLSWNEQAVYPHARGSLLAVADTAREAAERFGKQWRTLEPLYSLADFCYAVKQEVVEAIGGADEGYALGPCWEMDYNIRAARAGFRGVWVQDAYVFRAPFTPRRRRSEHRFFEASKRRYQDKFCALQLEGRRRDYEAHCLGEACEHFAPQDAIQLTMPLETAPETLLSYPEALPAPCAPSAPSQLLVSCVMPTGNRAPFALQAVRYFQRQTYHPCELIILDDGQDGLQEQLPDDDRIQYLHLPEGLSIGEKRNLGCQAARGEIIAQWDDDDWYAPGRLQKQMDPLLKGSAQISALTDTIFFEFDAWQFWKCTPALYRRLFFENVHGGTLVFYKWVWERYARYPHRSLAEDASFLRSALSRGAKLQAIPGENDFIYLRHARNSWSFKCGEYLQPQAWIKIEEPASLAPDRFFYRRISTPLTKPQAASACEEFPLVSCIMPTYNRPHFISQAIGHFQKQDYPNRELIVLDDGSIPVRALIPDEERIRYQHSDHKLLLGKKRNLACEMAAGEIIVHWDDDDWMAPWRLSYQVRQLESSQALINGLDKIIYYDLLKDRGWQYVYPGTGRSWVAGNTLCFRKSFWKRNPFPELDVGEDTRFVWRGRETEISPLADNTFYVAMIHAHNISPKRTVGSRWQPFDQAVIKELMADDWELYQSIAQSLPS